MTINELLANNDVEVRIDFYTNFETCPLCGNSFRKLEEDLCFVGKSIKDFEQYLDQRKNECFKLDFDTEVVEDEQNCYYYQHIENEPYCLCDECESDPEKMEQYKKL